MHTYPGFLCQRTDWAEPLPQQIFKKTSLDALLLSDLSTNWGTAENVQQRHELRQGVHHAALAQLLCILTEHIAWTKPGDDTCGKNQVHGKFNLWSLLWPLWACAVKPYKLRNPRSRRTARCSTRGTFSLLGLEIGGHKSHNSPTASLHRLFLHQLKQLTQQRYVTPDPPPRLLPFWLVNSCCWHEMQQNTSRSVYVAHECESSFMTVNTGITLGSALLCVA